MEILYSLIVASGAMLGTVIILIFHKWSKENSFIVINFVAGVMLTLAFTHLIPKGLELNCNSMSYVLFGFFIMFFMQFIFHSCCHVHDCFKNVSVPSIVGLSLHSIIDGFVIVLGFETNSDIGIFTTFVILFHKITDGITISGILLHKKASKEKIFKISLLTACFTPIGTIIGMFLFRNMSASTLGALISTTAGTFIFLSASDLIPETHNCKSKIVPIMLLIGAIVVFIVDGIVG
ncbi:MAG: ZIP family metal transporter [Endomicrobium sp.]|jgi:ZIP family zinc transporter/zinc and cadmium transporter|nr:ZIP family metal transporter [Endomicrobium sp.]